MKYLSLLLSTAFLTILFYPPKIFAAISLTISNIQKQDSFYSVDALVSGIASSSSCFVQAVITAPGSPHYFGQTWSSKGEWFKYLSSPEESFIQGNFIKLENDHTTQVLFNSDPDDSDYKGPGEYLLKLKRYTGNSTSAAGESDSLTFTISDPIITATLTSTPTVTTTPTITTIITMTSTRTPTPTPNKTPTSTNTTTPTTVKTATPSKSPKIPIASISAVLGESTSSASISSEISTPPTPSVSSSPQNKITNYKTPFFVGIFLCALSGGWLYFRRRND